MLLLLRLLVVTIKVKLFTVRSYIYAIAIAYLYSYGLRSISHMVSAQLLDNMLMHFSGLNITIHLLLDN